MGRALEVAFGEAQEQPIFDRWREFSPTGKRVAFGFASPRYADFDVFACDKRGLPVCYLEIKSRRVPFARFGDVLLPQRKRELAKKLKAKGIPFLAVTEYSCGALVEVDLTDRPTKSNVQVVRRDRGNCAVEHVLYAGDKVKVLA